MNISRHGASAYYGHSSITLNEPSFFWNESHKVIEIKKSRVKDFNTESRHNYTIALSLEEIAKVLQAVAGAANKSPDLLYAMNPQVLKSLLQIQAAIVGFLPQSASVKTDIP